MYPTVFEIRVDEDRTSTRRFYPGQVIEGRLILVLKKEKFVRGIVIRLIGKGNVYWDTGIKHNNIFSESETYIHQEIPLYVPPSEGGGHGVLPPGAYEYYFSLTLPDSLPSSLEGAHCFIRYYLEAALQRPWKDDQVVEAVIHVTSMVDLTQIPPEPASLQKEKHVGFNPCGSGPITTNFIIGKNGLVPGEYLQFGAEIRNTSSTRVNRVAVSLKRQLSCHAKGETKTTWDKILQVGSCGAEVGGYLLWQDNFEIPYMPPSSLPRCSIITLKYFVEVKLVLEKWADVKFVLPIEVGTALLWVDKARSRRSSSVVPDTPSKKVGIPLSRKNSIRSPITGEEFHYSDTELNQITQDTCLLEAPVVMVPIPNGHVHFSDEDASGGSSSNNGLPPYSLLPPLDFSFFQHKPEKSVVFKSYDDNDWPLMMMQNLSLEESEEGGRPPHPPRPHSNPAQQWQNNNTDYWSSHLLDEEA